MKEDNGKVDLSEALQCIVSYNGHKEWLLALCEELKRVRDTGEKYVNYPCPFDPQYWHTEDHTIWQLLVGAFGDWGTSIRSGWIEDFDGCIKFIEYLIEDDEEEADDERN